MTASKDWQPNRRPEPGENPTPEMAGLGILEVRIAAAKVGVDERTLRRWIAGEHVRGVAGERCKRATAMLSRGE